MSKHFLDKILPNCGKLHTFVNCSSSSNKSKLGLQSSGILVGEKYRHFPTYIVSNYVVSDIRSFKQSNATRYIYNFEKDTNYFSCTNESVYDENG